jgi:hypothetical protein
VVSGSESEVTASTRIGVSAGFTFRIVGGKVMFGGNCPPAALIPLRMSAAAPSILRLRSNCTVTDVKPSVLDEAIWTMPGICPNCNSSGVATADAMVCGSAHGSCAVTEIVG